MERTTMFSAATDKYAFDWEPLAPVIEEMKPILAENHAETGLHDMPFFPDYDRYLGLDQQGHSVLFTIREKPDLILVGFGLFFLDTEIQQKDVVSARQSLNFIRKGHRGTGYSFMKFCDDMLKKQGVNCVWRQSTSKLDIGKVYERLGYTLAEQSYVRRL